MGPLLNEIERVEIYFIDAGLFLIEIVGLRNETVERRNIICQIWNAAT